MLKITAWYSTIMSLGTAIVYFLAGLDVLSDGLVPEADESPPFIFFVAGVFYLLVGYLVHLKKRRLRLTLGILNALIILVYFQMWAGTSAVLISPAGLGTKIFQILLEIGLIYLIIKTWNNNRD